MTNQSEQGSTWNRQGVRWQGNLDRQGTLPIPGDLPRACIPAWSRLCQWIQTIPQDQKGVALIKAGRLRLGVVIEPKAPEGVARAWTPRQLSLADPFEIAPNAPAEPIPSLEHLEGLLKGPDSAFYLGGAQALVDGARVSVLDAGEPDRDDSGNPIPVDRGANLWRLVPLSVRQERTIALPDPKNLLNADILSGVGNDLPQVWQAERLGDYPEGRYELSLHEAIDHGDEAMVEKLLRRQSPRQVLVMGIVLLLGFLIMGALLGK